jgi:hypothetical protein
VTQNSAGQVVRFNPSAERLHATMRFLYALGSLGHGTGDIAQVPECLGLHVSRHDMEDAGRLGCVQGVWRLAPAGSRPDCLA